MGLGSFFSCQLNKKRWRELYRFNRKHYAPVRMLHLHTMDEDRSPISLSDTKYKPVEIANHLILYATEKEYPITADTITRALRLAQSFYKKKYGKKLFRESFGGDHDHLCLESIQAEFAEYGDADLRFATYCTKEDVIQLMADRKLIDQALDCVVHKLFTV